MTYYDRRNYFKQIIGSEKSQQKETGSLIKKIKDLYGTSIAFKGIKVKTFSDVWAITCDMSKEELEAYEKKLCDRTKSDTTLEKPEVATPISFLKKIENIHNSFGEAQAWIKLYKGANNVAIEFTCSTHRSIGYESENEPSLSRMSDDVNLENLSEEEIKYLLDELIIPELDFLIKVLDEQRGIEQLGAQGFTH